jgi:DNA-binding CsgD family transcriptional regulator
MATSGLSTNGRGASSSVSTTPKLEVDWTRLSPRGTAIARQIGSRLLEGYSPREIGRQLGTTTRWVSNRLDELRDELERLNE